MRELKQYRKSESESKVEDEPVIEMTDDQKKQYCAQDVFKIQFYFHPLSANSEFVLSPTSIP